MSTKSITLFLLLLVATSVHAGKITDRPLSRVGLTFQGGYGFQNIDMVDLEEGGTSTISFGGGAGGSFLLGHEFSSHFDLSASIGVYATSLQPVVSNADITFSSFRFSITPAYIIPIRDGNRMRVKVGAGFDLSFSNELEINMEEIPDGFKDTWTYDRAVGYHISGNFEVNASRRWLFSGGLQYNGINYDFESSSNRFPIDSDLESPNGSDIIIVFGAYYCF